MFIITIVTVSCCCRCVDKYRRHRACPLCVYVCERERGNNLF